MFKWLAGLGSRREFPEYSQLRAVPTRALPPDLALDESSDGFAARRLVIEESLRRTYRDPEALTLRFTTLVTSDKRGVITFTLPGEAGRCVPVFSSPFRAHDYRQKLLTATPVGFLASTATQLSGVLATLRSASIASFALDRCPRCSVVTVTSSDAMRTPNDLLVLWAIHKATEIARQKLYLAHALRSARAGQLIASRDVALEAVGHISMEDPRLHLLLGELAVALSDRVMLRESQSYLRFLKAERWQRRLDLVAKSGRARFEDYE